MLASPYHSNPHLSVLNCYSLMHYQDASGQNVIYLHEYCENFEHERKVSQISQNEGCKKHDLNNGA